MVFKILFEVKDQGLFQALLEFPFEVGTVVTLQKAGVVKMKLTRDDGEYILAGVRFQADSFVPVG